VSFFDDKGIVKAERDSQQAAEHYHISVIRYS
jgi:hypothetical protein